jgi:hypothetical protein
MAYSCPRCGESVQRGSNPGAAAAGGAVGALIAAAFGSFQCKSCGPIPRREFSPEVRSQMTLGSVGLAVGAVVLLIAAVVLLIYLRHLG